MARFQAQINPVLEDELRALQEQMALRPNQRADLLREISALASWVIRQASEGRVIMARDGEEVRELVHPVVQRVRQQRTARSANMAPSLKLDDGEVTRLQQIMDAGFQPTPQLREALGRLEDPTRQPPALSWPDTTGP
jgi:hypothetical protein